MTTFFIKILFVMGMISCSFAADSKILDALLSSLEYVHKVPPGILEYTRETNKVCN